MSDDPTPDVRPAREDVDLRGHDRVGGPGQASANPVEPGAPAPAPDQDIPEHDQAVKDRREHLKQKSEDASDAS